MFRNVLLGIDGAARRAPALAIEMVRASSGGLNVLTAIKARHYATSLWWRNVR